MNDFMYEDGHSKAVKKRIKQKKDNNEKRMLNELNYKHSYSDATGKHGTVKIGNGPEVDFHLANKKNIAKYNLKKKDDNNNIVKDKITVSKNVASIKGSDLIGTHEYGHAIQYKGDIDENNQREKYGKSTSKENKRLIKKHEKISGVKLTKHDIQNDEIDADAFSIVNTHGKNNVNRSRRAVNEYTRRTDDRDRQKVQFISNKIKETMDDLDNMETKGAGTVAKGLAKKVGNVALKKFDKVNEKIKNSKDKNNRENTARYNVANDYAKANKDKIKKLI